MTREPVIQDKIHLLMEETGCDQRQAELAITSAGYDLEKAIRTIGTLLRNIAVVRGKFLLPEKNLYGLVILIADLKRRSLFRGRAVVSYNPAIFETPLDVDWYDFEKSLYAFRLWEGTLQTVTQELEHLLLERLGADGEKFYDMLRDGREAELKDRLGGILAGHFPGSRVELSLMREELDLNQFKRFKTGNDSVGALSGLDRISVSSGGESVSLNVDVEPAADGVPAKDVRPGDSVQIFITDERDIGQYLAKLLGARHPEGLKALPMPVEERREEAGLTVLQVRLSAGILGVAKVPAETLLRVQRLEPASWWKKLLPSL